MTIPWVDWAVQVHRGGWVDLNYRDSREKAEKNLKSLRSDRDGLKYRIQRLPEGIR